MDLNDNQLQNNPGFYPQNNQLINNNKMNSMLNSNQPVTNQMHNNKMGLMINSNQQIPNQMQNFNQMNNMYSQFNNNRQNG